MSITCCVTPSSIRYYIYFNVSSAVWLCCLAAMAEGWILRGLNGLRIELKFLKALSETGLILLHSCAFFLYACNRSIFNFTLILK